jgi:hypothetical protein
MVSLIWALGSTLVIMLLISFLPLKFTLKGKLIAVLTSLLLALGGLAASASFPLWQTALMLGVLSFFIAYFLDKRIGTLIYKENSIIADTFEDMDETSDSEYHLDMVKSVDLVQVNEELAISESAQVNVEKVSELEVSPAEQLSEIDREVTGNLELIDEDISFLIERNIEDKAEEEMKALEPEIGYLSDIESLLADVTEEKVEAAADVLAEISDLPTNDGKQKLPTQLESDPLDDSLFDFLLATKEVASGSDNILEEIKTMEKVSLQK